MPKDHTPSDPRDFLLDWHLDRLNSSERAWMDEQLRVAASLRLMTEQLTCVLQPLDHWVVAPPPQNLPDKVLNRIARASALRPIAVGEARSQRSRERDLLPSRVERPQREVGPFPFRRLRDLVAAAACLIILIGISITGVSELRAQSQRAVCAGNLASIFRGTGAYQQASGGLLPYAGKPSMTAWLPNGAGGRPYASNSRHVYRLVKLGFVGNADAFACPGSGSDGNLKVVDDWSAYDDFPCADNVTIATLNLAGPRPNVRPAKAIAYAGDTNPLFVDARFDASVDPYETNSPAHRGRGQNVLTLDGGVRWIARPVYGPKDDNLWLIDNIRHYTGTEAPDGDDVQLVPGFPATDPHVVRVLAQ